MTYTENHPEPTTAYKASPFAIKAADGTTPDETPWWASAVARLPVLLDLCNQRSEAEWRAAIARDGLQAAAALTLWDAVEAGYMHETPQLAAEAALADGYEGALVIGLTVDHLAAHLAGQGWDRPS